MKKKHVQVDVEPDLHAALEKQASARGATKEEIIKECAQKFLSMVSDTPSGDFSRRKTKRINDRSKDKRPSERAS